MSSGLPAAVNRITRGMFRPPQDLQGKIPGGRGKPRRAQHIPKACGLLRTHRRQALGIRSDRV